MKPLAWTAYLATGTATRMELVSIGQFVSNVGVPAAIAFFLMWKINGKLGALVGLQKELQDNTASNREVTLELSGLRETFREILSSQRTMLKTATRQGRRPPR